MNNGPDTTRRCIPGLGARVKKLRTGRGLSLQVAATRGHTTPQTWLLVERYDLTSHRTLASIALALEVPIEELASRRALTETAHAR